MDLFTHAQKDDTSTQPLAEALRPKRLEEMLGQQRILGASAPWRRLVESGQIPSLLLWGPPGTGKTTFALLLAQKVDAEFITVNAVDTGAKALREIGEAGRRRRLERKRKTLLFVDEIHRLNKGQQDVLLPFVERGDVVLVGATTENPSYEINSALLSRCRVLVFERLGPSDIRSLAERAAISRDCRIAELLTLEALERLIETVDGDARRLLNSLEVVLNFKLAQAASSPIGSSTELPTKSNSFDRDPAESIDAHPAESINLDSTESIAPDPAAFIDPSPAESIDSDPAAPIDPSPAESIDSDPAAPIDSNPAESIALYPTGSIDSHSAPDSLGVAHLPSQQTIARSGGLVSPFAQVPSLADGAETASQSAVDTGKVDPGKVGASEKATRNLAADPSLQESPLQWPLGSGDLARLLDTPNLRYDKTGDEHYDVISAFIKSVRGSDPDAAMYYLARMIKGGEDPVFIARRLVILASEDIGNADPRGLTVAVAGLQAVELVGWPEAAISLAQVTTYLASAPKSNRSYVALQKAQELVEKTGTVPIPLALRSSKTALMKQMGYGKGYRYSHDGPKGTIKQRFLPEELGDVQLYEPTELGFEKNIKQYLAWLRS